MKNKNGNAYSTNIQAGAFKISSAFGLKDFFGLIATYGLLLFLVNNPASAIDPNTLPSGYQAVSGNIQFSQNNNTLNVTSGSSKGIVNYQNFSVGQNATVNFFLPGANSAILNRVIGINPSEIFGSINSNGKVFLVNPNGVLFGPTAQVNVGSLLASTLPINNNDFLNGNIVFKQNGSAASIVNQGNINISQGGSLVFLGSAIQNSGTINAPLGNVVLAVGEQASVSLGNGLSIDVTVDEPLQKAVSNVKDAILNTGTIKADGGSIRLEADLQNAIYDRAVNNEGIIQANSLSFQNGYIELLGKSSDGRALAQNTGKLLATSAEGKGGSIKVLGDGVLVGETSLIDASGKTGGGEILIGGDLQGSQAELLSGVKASNAKRTYIAEGAQIKADAKETGDGGKVIVWADEAAWFYGDISAKGGALSGNGGFAEVSGKQSLDAPGLVNLSAQNGETGTLLYDPLNIVINAGSADGSDSTASANTLQHNANPLGTVNLLDAPLFGTFTIRESEIENSNANIVLAATNNITNNAQLDLLSGNSFTANAGNNIIFSAGSGLSTLNGNITLGAGNAIQLNNANLTATNGNVSLGTLVGNVSGTGTIAANNLSINTVAGNATQTGAAGGAAINTNVTNLTVTSVGGTVRVSDADGVNLNTSTVGLGSLSVRAGGAGNITQSGTVTGNSLNFRTATGDVNLGGFANNANSLSLQTDGGNASFQDTNGFNVNSAQLNDGAGADGNLTLTAGGAGNITQSGAITQVNNFDVNSGTGSVTLNNTGNDVSAFTANSAAGNASTVAFTDANSFTVGSSNVANGTLSLTAAANGAGAGNIVQQVGTSIQGNNLQLKVGSGEAAFLEVNNSFNNLQATASNGTIAYLDVDDINLQASNVGTGTLGVGSDSGNITQSGILTGGNLVVGTGLGGDVTLSNPANDFSNLTGVLVSGGNISYTDANSINLSSYTATPGSSVEAQLLGLGLPSTISFDLGGGNLTLTAGGAGNITQSAAITQVNNFDVNSGTGSVTLNNTGNDVSTFTVNTAPGNISTIAFTDANGFTVGNSNVASGTLALTATAGNISQQAGSTLSGATLNLTLNNAGNASANISDADFARVSFTDGAGSGGNKTFTYSDRDGFDISFAEGNLILTSSAGGDLNGNPLAPGIPETSITSSGAMIGNALDITSSVNVNFTTVPVDYATIKVNKVLAGPDINVAISDRDGFQVLSSDVGSTTGSLALTSHASGRSPQTNGDPLGREEALVLNGDINGLNLSFTDAGNVGLINPDSGAITQISGKVTGTNLVLQTQNGNINLSSATNNVNTVDIRSAGGATLGSTVTATYRDADGFSLIRADLDTNNAARVGDLNLIVDSGSVDQVGAIGAIKARNLLIQTNDATFNLNNISNDVNNFSVSSSALSPNPNITLFDSDGINIINANVGSGSLNVTSDASGASVDNNRSTSFGSNTFSLIAQGTNRGINVSASVSAINGDVNLTARRGDITQSIGSSLVGDNLNAITENGNIDLPNALLGLNPQNDFDTVTLNATGGSARYYDIDGVRLGASSATNNLVVVSDTQTSADLNGNANSGIRVVGNVSAGNTVNLVALEAGNINNNATGFISANNVILEAQRGRIGTGANPLEIDANNLSASAERVDIRDVDDVNLTTQFSLFAAPLDGYPIHLVSNEATVGNYNLDGATTSSGDLTVITSVTAANNVNLTTGQNNSAIIVQNGLPGLLPEVLAGNDVNLLTNGSSSDIRVDNNALVVSLNGDATAQTLGNGSNIDINGAFGSLGSNAFLLTDGNNSNINVNGLFGAANNAIASTLGTNADINVNGLMIGFNNAVATTTGNRADVNVSGVLAAANNARIVTSGTNADIDISGLVTAGNDARVRTTGDRSDITVENGALVNADNRVVVSTRGTNADIVVDGDLNSNNASVRVSTRRDDSTIQQGANSNITAFTNVGISTAGDNADIGLGGNINSQGTVNVLTDGFDSDIFQVNTSTVDGVQQISFNTLGDFSFIQLDGSTNSSSSGVQVATQGNLSRIGLFSNSSITAAQDVDINTSGDNSDIAQFAGSNVTAGQDANITTVGLNGDIALDGQVNANNFTLSTAQNNSTINLGPNSILTATGTANITTQGDNSNTTQDAAGVIDANRLNVTTTTSDAALVGQNRVFNFLANTTSGNITFNNLVNLNLLDGSNVGSGSLFVTNAADVNFPLDGSLLGLTLGVTTTNNGNINLFNAFVGGRTDASSSISLVADGNINGLNRTSFPRLFARNIVVEGDKVADRLAPIGLWQGITSGYILDRSNQTTLSPASFGHVFGGSQALNAIRTLLVNRDGYFIYPELVFDFDNSIFKPNRAKDGITPVIARAIPRGPSTSAFGNLFVSSAGTYVLYGKNQSIASGEQIKQADEYINATGKFVLPSNSSLASSKLSDSAGFVKTAGQIVSPVEEADPSMEYNIFAGTVLPINNSEINFARDFDREINKTEANQNK